MAKLLRMVVFLGLLISLLAGCSTPAAVAPGILKGKVTVGPLTPVERVPEPGETPSPIPAEVFTSRSVDILKADGRTLVKHVPFQGDGTYQVELPPGTYVVASPAGQFEHARELPKTIVLKSGAVVVLDLDIDTGIR
jgi:hypothetical protein